ncbi:MAG: hypothetical protein AAF215_34755 [Cyanobacteria bacterium P01_A01_bin.123]
MFVLYIYIQHPDEVEIRKLFKLLKGFEISHLGPTDPPKKFSGDVDEVIYTILECSDLASYTFAKVDEGKIEIDFEFRNKDERWTFSTISMSGKCERTLREIEVAIGRTLKTYMSILGLMDGGKDQKWSILTKAIDCPHDLLSRFSAA